MPRTNTTTTAPSTRRGRPPADRVDQHRAAVLDAAYAELIEHGYQHLTMAGVARRAGASKETLYAWFSNKTGMFRTLIDDNADTTMAAIDTALTTRTDARTTLTGFVAGLLAMLTSDRAVALNRAAMASPELSTALLERGRHRVGPLVEQYLAELDRTGELRIPDPAEAFRTLYGLGIRDTQIRVLLGETPPDAASCRRQALTAVTQFFALHQPPGQRNDQPLPRQPGTRPAREGHRQS